MSMWMLIIYHTAGGALDTYYFDEKPEWKKGGSGSVVFTGKNAGREQEVWLIIQNVAGWSLSAPSQQQ